MSEQKAKIANAREEIRALKSQIANKRRALHDVTLGDIVAKQSIKSVPEIKLKTVRTLKGHLSKVYALGWAGDGKHIASAGQDGKILIWNGWSEHKVAAVVLKSTWVMSVAFSQKGRFVASGGLDNTCTIHAIPEEMGIVTEPFVELPGHLGYLSSVKFLAENQVLTSSGDGTCILWDVSRKISTLMFTGHDSDVMSVSAAKDQRTFVSGSVDGNAILWDLRTGERAQTFAGHESDINDVAYFPTSNAFVSGSDDATTKLWDIRAGAAVGSYSHERILAGVTSVDVSSSGRIIYVGYDDHNILGWDTLTERQVESMEPSNNRVSAVEVSPDGYALATSSWDSTIRIYSRP